MSALTVKDNKSRWKPFQDGSIGLLDQCLGALVLQQTRKHGKSLDIYRNKRIKTKFSNIWF
jgi:hypothetical protein